MDYQQRKFLLVLYFLAHKEELSILNNIKTLKDIVYDKPFGMMRKYEKLYKNDVQRL